MMASSRSVVFIVLFVSVSPGSHYLTFFLHEGTKRRVHLFHPEKSGQRRKVKEAKPSAILRLYDRPGF